MSGRQFSNPGPPSGAAPAPDPWTHHRRRLVEQYGVEKGLERYIAQRFGTDPDLIAWRALGERGRP